MSNTVVCQYCQNPAVLVSGKDIYPRREDLYDMKFYNCEDCGAYVGCHKGTDKPLGTLANRALRNARCNAHKQFDPIWRNRYMSRNEAYMWASEVLELELELTHIGMLDINQCNKLSAESYKLLNTFIGRTTNEIRVRHV